MTRTLAAVVLGLHGLIHLIGFVAPWRVATLESLGYRTSVFNGALDIGDGGVRVIGLLWLGLTVGFLAAAYGVWRAKPWATGLTGILALIFLIICVVGLPETAAGIAINLGILAAVGYVGFRSAASLARN